MCLETRPVSVRLSASAVHGQEWRNIETRDNIVTHSWHHAPQWGGGLSGHKACHSTQWRRISQKRPQWSQLRLQCYRGRSGLGFWREDLYQLDINWHVEIWIWRIILYFIREVMRNRLKYCSKEWINCVTLPCTPSSLCFCLRLNPKYWLLDPDEGLQDNGNIGTPSI